MLTNSLSFNLYFLQHASEYDQEMLDNSPQTNPQSTNSHTTARI